MKRALPALGLALTLAGCATANRYDAAGDVHALLVAIRDDDRAAFDARVDRGALKGQLETRIANLGRRADSSVVAAFAVALAGPASDLAGDLLLRPSVFRAVADYYGYTPDRPLPNRLAIAGALRPTDGGQVCAARRDGPCILTFALEDGTWRLVRFDGDDSLLRPLR